MFLGVLEATAGGQDDSREVEQGDEREELSVCVEPKIEQDPSADFWLLRFLPSWLLHGGV